MQFTAGFSVVRFIVSLLVKLRLYLRLILPILPYLSNSFINLLYMYQPSHNTCVIRMHSIVLLIYHNNNSNIFGIFENLH